MLDDATAEHDQVGPEERVQAGEVHVDAARPFLPAELQLVLRRDGRPRVRDLAVDLEVSELGVRYQLAVREQRGSDPGAERDHRDDAGLVARDAEPHLGEAGRVRVVEHRAGRPVASESSACALVPIHALSMFVAVRTIPPVTTAGSVQPIGPATS